MTIKGDGNLGIGTTDHFPEATPSNGLYGSDGTRLILWPAAADTVPYSFGITNTT
jgi:hypothetical protein